MLYLGLGGIRMDMLLKLAIIVLAGCLAGKLAKAAKLSNVFGFLLAGVFLGPSGLKLVSGQDLTSLSIVGEIAVAILAFKIGSEFVLKDMNKLGRPFMIITFAEVAGAVLVAFSVMHFWLKQDPVFSLIIASIAATTAPAATIMVMRQFRSDGPVTRTLIPVAALDGVLGVFLFGIAMSIAQNVMLGVDSRLWQIVGRAMLEVFGSLVLGALLGLGLTFLARKAGDSDELLLMTIAMILASTGAAKALTMSPLLTNIVMGTVLVNLTQNANRVFFSLNNFTPPVYLLFFTLAGASVNLRTLQGVGLIGLGYILARAAGKLLGAWTGSKVVGAEPTVQKYLGVALLPQGGLSVALAVLAYHHLPAVGMAVIAIMVCGALLYEVAGPIMAKTAIQRAGEIRGMTSTIR